MGIFKIKGYHGTDSSVVDDILRVGFKCKENKEHWLGEGIYLYVDKSLAEWWTTNPTNKHGVEIHEPAIIECSLEVEEDRVLNLCTLDGYRKYVNLYNSFFRQWAYNAKDEEEVNIKQLRCAFFNYLLLLYKVDVIIAPFILPGQPYMPQYHNEKYAKEMHIMYAEVQICISEKKQEIIKNKTVEIEGDNYDR